MPLALPVIDSIVKAGEKLIDRLVPDLQAAEKNKQEWAVMVYQGDLATTLAQIEVNKEEAKSDSIFVSGWRPATGWICVAGLAYTFVLAPLITWGSTNFGFVAPPLLELDTLIALLGGMLGLTATRTFEKVKGVSRETMKTTAPKAPARAEESDPYIG